MVYGSFLKLRGLKSLKTAMLVASRALPWNQRWESFAGNQKNRPSIFFYHVFLTFIIPSTTTTTTTTASTTTTTTTTTATTTATATATATTTTILLYYYYYTITIGSLQ